MRHAGPQTLDQLEPLLAAIRRYPGLREKSRGVFYHKSKALLHFHEDDAGLFADLRADADWERLPVNTAAERRRVLARVKEAVAKV
jgi:hypothetical protein